MREYLAIFLTALLILILPGCGSQQEARSWPTEAEYTDLTGEASRNLLTDLLDRGQIPPESQAVLLAHMDQITPLLEPDEQASQLALRPIDRPLYDPYELQDRWQQAYPDFPGYNCRITAFSLFRHLLEIDKPADRPDNFLFLDADALDQDSSALPTREAQMGFYAFCSTVPTENSRDPQVHLKNWQQHWQDLGVRFTDDPQVRLISVIFHDQIDSDMLSMGHAGIALPQADGSLYFLEKLSFQEPYRLSRFDSRAQLSDYLMTRYDVAFNQPTASPLILENDRLIEGYRPRS